MNKARTRWVPAGWWLSDEEVVKLKDALSNAVRDLHAHQERLDLLRTRLRQVAEMASAPAGEAPEVDPWWARAVLQIKANLDFLYGEGIEPDLLKPIREVTAAFEDLERGASSRYLIPHRSEDEQRKRRPGAPTPRLMRTFRKAEAAAALTLLRRAGLPERQAVATVAARLGDRLPFRNQGALRSYRDRLMACQLGELTESPETCKKTIFHAVRHYDKALESFKDMPPAKGAEDILQSLLRQPG